MPLNSSSTIRLATAVVLIAVAVVGCTRLDRWRGTFDEPEVSVADAPSRHARAKPRQRKLAARKSVVAATMRPATAEPESADAAIEAPAKTPKVTKSAPEEPVADPAPEVASVPPDKPVGAPEAGCGGNEICLARVEAMLADKSRSWLGSPQPPADYSTGARLVVYAALRKQLSCAEVAVALVDVNATRTALTTLDDAPQGEELDRLLTFADVLERELSKEASKRCKS